MEIDNKSAALSMRERRVLILINGQRTAAQVKQMSMLENFAEIIDKLNLLGLIGLGGSSKPRSAEPVVDLGERSTDPVIERSTETREHADPKLFMSNTLLRFANRMRVKSLLEEIENASDVQALKSLVRPWYDAIAETPTGLYQADELKTSLLEQLLNDEMEEL